MVRWIPHNWMIKGREKKLSDGETTLPSEVRPESNGPLVTGMTIWEVSNRIAGMRSHGIGTISGSIRRILVRIDTDAGISGYGEASPWAVFSGLPEASSAVLEHYFWPVLKFRDAYAIAAIMEKCGKTVVGCSEAKAAVETALYDILGKSCGLPISQLFGGKIRDRIPLSFTLAHPDLEVDLQLATTIYDDGVRIFKIKTGFLENHDDDVRRVEQICNQLPDDIDIRIDYNQGLEVFGSLQKLRQMEQFQPTYIEQPVRADQWDTMADLTARLDVPILADESVFDAVSAWEASRRKIANAFSIKLMKAGGLNEARAIAVIAEQAGLPCFGGTLFEGPISLNAAAHLVVSTGNISLGCEFYLPRYGMLAEELETQVNISEGHFVAPIAPGLGIEVDEEIIRKCATREAKLSVR